MFLNGFSGDEKSAFFSLAQCILDADKVVAENEEVLLAGFLHEMEMSIDQVDLLAFNEAVDVFSRADETTRRQMYIELFALAICDSDFAPEEKELLSAIAVKLGISKEKEKDIQECIHDLLNVYSRLNALIKG